MTTTSSADLVYLCRALKAPSLAAAIDRLAERARTESWTHEEFLAACLEREVAARQHVEDRGAAQAQRRAGPQPKKISPIDPGVFVPLFNPLSGHSAAQAAP